MTQLIYPFHDGGRDHIETRANQWAGFYMIGTSIMKEFTHFSLIFLFYPLCEKGGILRDYWLIQNFYQARATYLHLEWN